MGNIAEAVGRSRDERQVMSSTQRLMGDEFIEMDQEARDLAHEARNKIKAHEDLCTERWTQSRDSQKRVEGCLAEMKTALDERIGKMPAAIIAGLTGLVGFLAARAWPIH